MYTIVSLGKDDTSKITVQAEDEPPITLLRGQFFRAFRLPYAFTYACCQGLTLTGLVALHDTDHGYFTRRKLYVAMSRATGCDKLVVWPTGAFPVSLRSTTHKNRRCNGKDSP